VEKAARMPEAFCHLLWHYRMTGLEGTLAFIENDTKAQQGYVSCQGHKQPRLDRVHPILHLLNEKREVKRTMVAPRETERVFSIRCSKSTTYEMRKLKYKLPRRWCFTSENTILHKRLLMISQCAHVGGLYSQSLHYQMFIISPTLTLDVFTFTEFSFYFFVLVLFQEVLIINFELCSHREIYERLQSLHDCI